MSARPVFRVWVPELGEDSPDDGRDVSAEGVYTLQAAAERFGEQYIIDDCERSAEDVRLYVFVRGREEHWRDGLQDERTRAFLVTFSYSIDTFSSEVGSDDLDDDTPEEVRTALARIASTLPAPPDLSDDAREVLEAARGDEQNDPAAVARVRERVAHVAWMTPGARCFYRPIKGRPERFAGVIASEVFELCGQHCVRVAELGADYLAHAQNGRTSVAAASVEHVEPWNENALHNGAAAESTAAAEGGPSS